MGRSLLAAAPSARGAFIPMTASSVESNSLAAARLFVNEDGPRTASADVDLRIASARFATHDDG